MMAAVSAMVAHVGESSFARLCGKVGDVLDCMIPITLVVAIVVGCGLIAFSFVH
jgi:hypothetical protein